MTQWTSTIERADRLISEGKSAEAVPLLMASLDQLRGVSGTAVAHFHPRLLGRLGQALREVGDKDEAIRVTREALDLCKQTGDGEGVQVYTRNLQTLGAPEFAQSLGDAGFHIVFCDADDRVLSPDEVSVASGTIRFEVRSGRKIHPEAQRLHEEGRATGGRGDHTGAIALFNQAAAIEPAWPYPVYDRAFAHLIMREFDAALVDYRKVLELAPKGFYVAAQAADLLTREAAGEFPAGLYLAFAMLEHIPKEQQQSIAEQFVERFPSHAPAWNLLANGIQDPSAKLTAIERGLAARPDPDTRGSLLILKASSLHALGQTTSALELLESLREAPDSLSTQATATITAAAVRSSLTSASAPSHRLAPDDHS
jgi:tetratricopeptide (TPR) repeat protein